MKQPNDRVLLLDMLDHARLAVAAADGRTRADLDADPVLAAALERFVEVIGEAATKVSQSVRDGMSEIPWREIIGMRNRLIHGYAAVDRDIIWTVVTEDLPSLIASLQSSLDT